MCRISTVNTGHTIRSELFSVGMTAVFNTIFCVFSHFRYQAYGQDVDTCHSILLSSKKFAILMEHMLLFYDTLSSAKIMYQMR
jgi:hypothetical protein